MSEIVYKIGSPKEFSESEKKRFRALLVVQGKVSKPTIEKVNRCYLLCLCKVDNEIISIGAIKPKTNSDFNNNKADLDKLRNDFQKELGYCFTLPNHTGHGYSSALVQQLLKRVEKENLMASTELRLDNSMIRILERNGFKQYGNPWKSGIHNGTLGLFLRYIK
jgi:GNAT superfamily N-acetyltransferase